MRGRLALAEEDIALGEGPTELVDEGPRGVVERGVDVPLQRVFGPTGFLGHGTKIEDQAFVGPFPLAVVESRP